MIPRTIWDMTDEAPIQATPVADTAPAVQAETVSAAPVPEVAPIASVPETAATEAAPVATLLGAEPSDVVVDPKTDTPLTEEVKVEAVEEVKAEVPLQTYEFTLPEGVTLAPEVTTEFSSMLGEFAKNTGLKQEDAQALGTSFLNYGVQKARESAEAAIAQTKAYYEGQVQERASAWAEQFEKDPEIGGNRRDTTLSAAQKYIATHGGTAEQQKEFRSLLNETGLGNHPVMIRMLANGNLARSEGRPLPAVAPVPEKMGKLEKMYGRQR